MSLRYPPFKNSMVICNAAQNAPPLRMRATNTGVAILQGALIDLGYKMPISIRKNGAPDGIYGNETKNAVWKFQSDQKMGKDGVAGRHTIARLDSVMATKYPKKKVTPPKPAKPSTPAAPPSTRQYEVGTGDPHLGHDSGSGAWNSESTTVTAIALKEAILQGMGVATVAVGDDAVKHLEHYFNNTGSDLRIDLIGMVNEVPSAKARYEVEVAQAKRFVEMLPPGRYSIRSKRAEVGYNTQRESRNWFFAVGGYSTWGVGTAEVTAAGECKLEFDYKFYDRYNWDKGKSVTLGGVTITDEFMGDFHRQGLAREYDEVGSFHKTFTWTKGSAIPPAQITPGGR